MPFPKIKNGHVDVMLTNILLAYTNSGYAADTILPIVPNLKKESGLIPKVGNAHLRRYHSKRTLYDEGQHRMNFTISKDDSYQIDYFDLDIYLPDRLQEQLDSPFNARKIAMMTNMEALKLDREAALAAILTDTAVLTNNDTLSGGDQWSDTVNSNPDKDIDTARDSVQQSIGREANGCHFSREVANAMRRHPWFLDIAQSAIKGGVSKSKALSVNGLIETLKAWYDFEYVTIGNQIKVTSQEGQTETMGKVWNDDMVLYHRPSAPALMAPSFGYSFQLSGKNMRSTVRREPLSDKGDLIGVDWAYEDNILDVDAAYLIKSVV